MSLRPEPLVAAIAETARLIGAAPDVPGVFAVAARVLGEAVRFEHAVLALLERGSEAVTLIEAPATRPPVRLETSAVPWLAMALGCSEPSPGPVSWPGSPASLQGLVLPLAWASEVLGAIALGARAPLDLGPGQTDDLLGWATLVAAELQRRLRLRAEEEQARGEHEREALRRFTVAISSELDVRRVFRGAMAEIREDLAFDEAAILALEADPPGLSLFAATIDVPDRIRLAVPEPASASARALRSGETVVVEDTARGEFVLDRRILELGFRSHLAHPLRRSGQLVGTLNLARRLPGGFPGLREGLLESVGSTLAIAVHNTLLFERVRASEDRYASLVESSREFIYRLDLEGRFSFANRAGAHLLGRPPGEIVGRPWTDFIHPEDASPEALHPLSGGERDQLSLDLRLLTVDGSEVLTSHSLHAIRAEGGKLLGIQGIARDVTRERQAERALRLHQELVEALDDYVFMADASGRLLAINRKARQELGWAIGEVGDMTIWDLHPPEDKAKVERERWRIVETGASSFEVRLLAKSGRTIPTRGRVTYSPASGTFQGVYRDVTEEQLIQERLLQVERLRALGEMASGVAHTFNNLLAVIGTTVQVAKRLVSDPAVLRELDAIQQAVYDGGAAVRRIQDFTRKKPAELHRDVDLAEVLAEVVRLASQRVRSRSGSPIQIETDLAPLPPVRGSDAELRDVFLNLFFNAIDAMPEGGTITLRSAAGSDGRLRIEVRDTGRGMTPEVRSRIFTPFFSTKGERGAGLGLAIALNVVSQHGGSIEVESEPGRGTTIRVLLPPAPLAGRRPGPPARVLIVETEPLLGTQLTRAIAKEGHTVEHTSSGDAALKRLEESPPVDCVFTAYALGPLSGLQVADRAKARGARVVLLADWADEVTEEKVREHQVDAVLRKPFPLESALNLIQALPGRGG